MLQDKKLRLNKQSRKIKKLNRRELREERGVLQTNLIEIKKNEKSRPGLH